MPAAILTLASCQASVPEYSTKATKPKLHCLTFSAQDLTEGSYPVTSVILKVNGTAWHDSGTISATYYQHSVSRQVGCGEAFTIEVIATDQYGQSATASKSITLPVP